MPRVGDELIRPMLRALDDVPVHGRQLGDMLRGLRTTQRRNRDGVNDVDTYDGPATPSGRPGDRQLPNPEGDGPVDFLIPDDATPEEVAQFHDYVDRSNQYLADGRLSESGRVSTAGEISREARREARLERARAAAAGEPYHGVVAHVPDSTWVGSGTPPGWGDYTPRVNASLAGQVNRYPVGYVPSEFRVRDS